MRVYVCDVVNNFGARLESTPIPVVVDFFFFKIANSSFSRKFFILLNPFDSFCLQLSCIAHREIKTGATDIFFKKKRSIEKFCCTIHYIH